MDHAEQGTEAEPPGTAEVAAEPPDAEPPDAAAEPPDTELAAEPPDAA
jgi:hypothetical protein